MYDKGGCPLAAYPREGVLSGGELSIAAFDDIGVFICTAMQVGARPLVGLVADNVAGGALSDSNSDLDRDLGNSNGPWTTAHAVASGESLADLSRFVASESTTASTLSRRVASMAASISGCVRKLSMVDTAIAPQAAGLKQLPVNDERRVALRSEDAQVHGAVADPRPRDPPAVALVPRHTTELGREVA